jgi:hypothetical protein
VFPVVIITMLCVSERLKLHTSYCNSSSIFVITDIIGKQYNCNACIFWKPNFCRNCLQSSNLMSNTSVNKWCPCPTPWFVDILYCQLWSPYRCRCVSLYKLLMIRIIRPGVPPLDCIFHTIFVYWMDQRFLVFNENDMVRIPGILSFRHRPAF